MRSLERYLPAGATAGSAVCVLTSITFFLVGIWTPDWYQVSNSDGFTGCDGKDACYQYQGDDRWFHTAWLFLLIAVALGGYRAWRYYENDRHSH